MGIFGSKAKEPTDTTARDYLRAAPPGARTEVLASACTLQARDLQVAAASRAGHIVPYDELAEAVALARSVMQQDQALVALIARKIVVNIGALHAVTDLDVGAFCDSVLRVNGVVRGTDRPLEIADGQHDEDGSALTSADSFWMTFRAVQLGRDRASSGEWGFYSSLYTDHTLVDVAYTVIAWGSVAIARLINSGALEPARFPTLGDQYRTVPPLAAPGWYPHPKKAAVGPDGDAPFKCYWDGRDWTSGVRILDGGRWKDLTIAHDLPPDD